MYQAALRDLPARADGDGHVHVFVETPAGSRHKLDLSHETGLLEWSLELPVGSVFPYAFGFVPNTLAEDGDPLDILLLADPGIPAGTVVVSRVIGVLRVRQDETGSGVPDTANDRVVAVPIMGNSYADVHDLPDLRSGFVDEIDGLFKRYNEMIGRAFDTEEPGGRGDAHALLDEAMERFERKG